MGFSWDIAKICVGAYGICVDITIVNNEVKARLYMPVATVGTLAIMSIKDHGIYCNSFKVADPARGFHERKYYWS